MCTGRHALQAAGGRGSSEVHSSTGHKHSPGCWAVARSGIPAREPLFNGTICRHPGRWGQLATSRGFTFGGDGGVEHLEVHPVAPCCRLMCLHIPTWSPLCRTSGRQIIIGGLLQACSALVCMERPGRPCRLAQPQGSSCSAYMEIPVPVLQVAPPAFLPVPGSLGLYQQGHGLSVFLNSRGEVSAYDPHGEQVWQVCSPQAYLSPFPAAGAALPCPLPCSADVAAVFLGRCAGASVQYRVPCAWDLYQRVISAHKNIYRSRTARH